MKDRRTDVLQAYRTVDVWRSSLPTKYGYCAVLGARALSPSGQYHGSIKECFNYGRCRGSSRALRAIRQWMKTRRVVPYTRPRED